MEKTDHPCQFPIELVERLILALTNKNDLVVDPYMGVGTAACAAVIHSRRAAGADIFERYVTVARDRVAAAFDGRLSRRPMTKPCMSLIPVSTFGENQAIDYPRMPLIDLQSKVPHPFDSARWSARASLPSKNPP